MWPFKKRHKHVWVKEVSDDKFRTIVVKIHHCECGAVKMLTAYGWRAYLNFEIIEFDKPPE